MPPLPLCAAPAVLATCVVAFPVHTAQKLIKLQGTHVRISHLPWEAGWGGGGGITAVSSSDIKQGWWPWLGLSTPFCACTCELAFWGDELSSPRFSFPARL